MATDIHTESTFEHAIEEHLLEHGGYARGSSADFDPALALDVKTLIAFLKESQPQRWAKLR